MPRIAYNSDHLIYDSETLSKEQATSFIIRDISEETFRILQTLPSDVFRLGKDVKETVGALLSQEKNSIEKAA